MRTQESIAESQIRVSKAAVPKLKRIAIELEHLGGDIIKRPFDYHSDAGADVMALTFAIKQIEHMRSIRVLLGARQHRDAAAIARSMLEGMGILTWAFHDSPARTDRWLMFEAILDWRRTQDNEADGVWMDPAKKLRLEAYVNKYGEDYIDGKVNKRKKEAEEKGLEWDAPDDPWGRDWTEVDLRSMFVAVGGESAYDNNYRLLSEWVHWSPRGILSSVRDDWADKLEFTNHDWRSAATALQVGTQSLQQTLEVLNLHFHLGFEKTLARLYEELVAELTLILGAEEQRSSL